MPTIITENELKKFIDGNDIIQNGATFCAQGVKYDFRLGNRFVKSKYAGPRDYDVLERDNLDFIAPGEVVYVMSEESLNLPNDIKIDLHEKRKLSYEGIVVLGGRSVDPSYNGKLFFGLQNISSVNFPLKPGRKLIGATFYRLSPEEHSSGKSPDPMHDFPEDLEKFVKNYNPVNTFTIEKKLLTLEAEVREELISKFDGLDNSVSKKVDDLNSKVNELDSKVNDLDRKVSALENLPTKVDNLETKIDELDKNLNEKFHILETNDKWIKALIVTVIGGIILQLLL